MCVCLAAAYTVSAEETDGIMNGSGSYEDVSGQEAYVTGSAEESVSGSSSESEISNVDSQDPVSGSGISDGGSQETAPGNGRGDASGRIVSSYSDPVSGSVSLDILINGTADINTVYVPTWGYPDQRDIIWYTAQPGEDGLYHVSYNISAHNNHWGVYASHVYAGRYDGSLQYIDGISCDMNFPMNEPQVTFSGSDFTVSLSGAVCPGISSVKAAVWSETNGQDDLSWHDLSYEPSLGIWSGSFSSSSLLHGGNIDFHLYAFNVNGESSFAGGKSIYIDESAAPQPLSGSVSIASADPASGEVSLDIQLSGSAGSNSVLVPTWSYPDQRDIVWYKASAGEDGLYHVAYRTADHNHHWGIFNSHVYIYENGGYTYIDGVSADLSFPIKTLSVDMTGSDFNIEIQDAGVPDISSVKAAVWSETNGQDDLSWQDLSLDRASGVWKGTVSSTLLMHDGIIDFHVYAFNRNGESAYAGGASYDMNADRAIIVTDSGSGNCIVTLSGVISSYDTPKAAVWSETNGQDDLVWYPMTYAGGNTWMCGFNCRDHYNTGTYDIHVYSGSSFLCGADHYIDTDTGADDVTALAASLAASAENDQLIIVSGSDADDCTCTVAMLNKNHDGTWHKILYVPGMTGRGGIGTIVEGDGKSPAGIFGFTEAFGIYPNPGTVLPYTQVDSTHYWVDDVYSPLYNRFVTTRTTPVNWNSAEHLIEFANNYQYCLNIDCNPECIPWAGSAIFLHVGGNRPTGGCVAVSESSMVTIMRAVRSGCKIIIDYASNIADY